MLAAVLQGVSVILWFQHRNGGYMLDLGKTTLVECILGATMMGAGQVRADWV